MAFKSKYYKCKCCLKIKINNYLIDSKTKRKKTKGYRGCV